ncbi:MAG: ring-1,2-phenylacetyl-CoA epoxidase subunit PaaE [Limisphaerales bacterium]|jgi:ring-1,2-phenylacetyl-CoA epoxidase subunit PaaE
MDNFRTLRVHSTREEPNDTLYVQFDVPEQWAAEFQFQQGQYLTFKADLEGGEVRRSYSICAGLGEALAVAIKKIDGGQFSEYAHASFRAGAEVSVLAPDGNFFTPIDPDCKKNYLLIAAGSGITPIISIAKSVLSKEPNSQVTLLYGNRRSVDVIFRESLLWLKNRYMHRLQWINIFSQETQAAEILNGRINNAKGGELDQRLIDIVGHDEFFLCGPEGMISEVSRGLRGMGIDESQIHYELFFASAEDAREAMAKHHERALQYAGLTTQVSVQSAGRVVIFELTADGENILDGAMRNGLDLPYSCKGGVCATCKAKVLEGEVDMDLNHALTQDELNAGFVLTCQSHPISRKVVIDFDAR